MWLDRIQNETRTRMWCFNTGGKKKKILHIWIIAMKSWLIQEEKKNPQRLPCETLCRSSLVKKKLVKHKKSNKKKTEKNARKGLYRLEFLRSFELSKWMKCYSYEWTISLTGITLFLTLWRGAYESFPLLWHSIQGLTLFTYSVYSVDRFS